MKLKNLLKNNFSYLKNVVISTGIYGTAAFVNYLFNVVLLRGLNAESFGIYSSALGIITLFQIPLTSISSAITKLIAKNHNRNLRSFKVRITVTFFLISSSFSLLFYLLSPFLSRVTNIPFEYMFPLTIVFFLSFFGSLPKGILYGLDKPNEANVLILFEGLIKIFLAFIAVRYSVSDVTLPILACGIPFLVSLVFIFPSIGIKEKNIKEEVSGFINLNETFIYTMIFLFLSSPYTLDVALVNPSFRPAYSALSLAEKVVYYASVAIASVMFARIANLKKDKDRKSVLLISVGITVLTGLSISLLFKFFPGIVSKYLFNGEYAEALPYLFTLGIGMTVYAVTYLLYNYFVFLNFNISIFWIIFTTILQVFLFQIRNDSLESVVENQIIVYSVLFAGTVFLFFLGKRKMDDTGIEPVTPTM